MMFQQDTEKLLKERGLKCICQLCDCGGPHRHKGCRLHFSKNYKVFNTGDKSGMQSSYQCHFGDFLSLPRTEMIQPKEKPQNPVQPTMDFRTENHESYKEFRNVERFKPCKLKGEIEKMCEGAFVDRTVYKDMFLPHQPNPSTHLRPVSVFRPSQSNKFHGVTEYKTSFPKKEKAQQDVFTEKPEHAYALMYPDVFTVPKKSVKNTVHDGRMAEKVSAYIPLKDHVMLGTDENPTTLFTTNNEHFKEYQVSPSRLIKPSYELKPREKFTAVTQNCVDFKYDVKDAKNAKGILFEGHPSLIKLSMDVPLDFSTVNRMSYNAFQIPTKDKRQTIKKTQEYVPPSEKFESKSTTQVDFKDFGVTKKIEMVKVPMPRKSSAKMETNSSYQSQYKSPGKINRILYGQQHSDNLKLPSQNKKIQGKSVTSSDFRDLGNVEKAKSFKPTYITQNNGGKFDKSTEYNDTFRKIEIKKCSLPQFIAKEASQRKVAAN